MAIAVLTTNETGANSLTDINANFNDLDTTKADLASPTFTGTPTLPTGTIAVTQSASDNSTKVATTAYVDAGDAAITASIATGVITSTVSLTSSEILNMYTTPKTLIAAPGAGKIIDLIDVVFYLDYVSTTYAGGGTVRFQFNGDTTQLLGTTNVDSTIKLTADAVTKGNFAPLSSATLAYTVGINKAVEMTNATGVFTTGNGTMKVFLTYKVITL